MKKKKAAAVIDFHSHILPSADHGSDSTETSLAQLKLMEKAGIEIAVATPHFYPHRESVEDFLRRRESSAAELFEAKKSDIKIALGAEVYCIAGLENTEGLERLTVRGTDTLLLEMPSGFWNTNIIETVLALDGRFKLVLAHIDRYPSSELEKLLYMGLRVQINAEGALRKNNRHRLAEWISEDIVYAVGSDLHKTDAANTKAFKKLQRVLKRDIDSVFARTAELIEGAELY